MSAYLLVKFTEWIEESTVHLVSKDLWFFCAFAKYFEQFLAFIKQPTFITNWAGKV